MAKSSFKTHQYPTPTFVESCGAIMFHLSASSPPKVCLLNYLRKNEYLLPKGRRNLGESRCAAALREATEETGYKCNVLPVKMATRAPHEDEEADAPDKARVVEKCEEPFMFTIRELGNGKGVKLIWWFIASLDGEIDTKGQGGEAQFRAEFFECHEAIEKLHFETDREVLRKAIELVEAS